MKLCVLPELQSGDSSIQQRNSEKKKIKEIVRQRMEAAVESMGYERTQK